MGTQLSKSKLLLDSSLKLDIAAEYNGVTYAFATADALNEFIDAPEQFVNPLPDMMPRKIRGMEMLQVRPTALRSTTSCFAVLRCSDRVSLAVRSR